MPPQRKKKKSASKPAAGLEQAFENYSDADLLRHLWFPLAGAAIAAVLLVTAQTSSARTPGVTLLALAGGRLAAVLFVMWKRRSQKRPKRTSDADL